MPKCKAFHHWCQPRLIFCVVLLSATVCQAQTDPLASADQAASWKKAQLTELDRRLEFDTLGQTLREEYRAQRLWLKNWSLGGLTSKPIHAGQQPETRIEPTLHSELADEIRKSLVMESSEQDEADSSTLNQACSEHPDDLGLQQLWLQWMDHPIRRKSFLEQIDKSASGLIGSLKDNENESDPTIRLALEFTMYRRGRGLAYRELPDVVKLAPIKDPERLNKQIQAAYDDLITLAGKGRPEFILLEIRMLRRDKQFGTALGLVEEYGSVIKPQWYLKKRRDLLKELEWEIPYAEAAKIYADAFPEEVAKELSVEHESDDCDGT